ncbi:MAG: diguanylate cyclase [Sedimenticola sp.]
MVLMSDADEDAQRRCAQRINEKVAEWNSDRDASLVEPLSISTGAAMLVPGETDYAAVLRLADEKMYHRKRSRIAD